MILAHDADREGRRRQFAGREEFGDGHERLAVAGGLIGRQSQHGRVAALLLGPLQTPRRPPGDRVPPVQGHDADLKPADAMIEPANVHELVQEQEPPLRNAERLDQRCGNNTVGRHPGHTSGGSGAAIIANRGERLRPSSAATLAASARTAAGTSRRPIRKAREKRTARTPTSNR